MTGAAFAARSLAPRLGLGAAVRRALLVAIAALCALIVPAIAAPNFPDLAGRITDQAGLLTDADKTEIEGELSSLEQTSTDQLAVVTVKSLEGYPIEDYGIGLSRKWGIGQKGKDNGILLIVAPNDRKVRIEVGRRLEPMMTDTMSALIIENAILPKFRRGDFAAGIKDGVRDIKSVLLGDAEEVKQRARGARSPQQGDPTYIIQMIIVICIIAIIIAVNVHNASNRPLSSSGSPGYRRGRRYGTIGGSTSSGSWSGGSSSSGSSDSGSSWSGGGGDFGGGGASGSW